ncbi:MAG UNVERIFIED_CONTAM: hypothetical protein LVR18_06935 [Planctomycetaceae bacterium]|jgi:hypothetical protein
MKSHPPSCHLICEQSPADGDWNMALDAALLALAIERAESVVRIYRWKAAYRHARVFSGINYHAAAIKSVS